MQYNSDILKLVPEIAEELGVVDSAIDHLFPHVSGMLTHLWGTVDCMDYLDDLLVVTGERANREGFPFEVLQELMIVQRIHHIRYPDLGTTLDNRRKDPWYK
jgi:hypothetical protein